MKQYWFQLPSLDNRPGMQIKIVADDSISMLNKLKEYIGWQDAIFLGGIKNETRTKKKSDK